MIALRVCFYLVLLSAVAVGERWMAGRGARRE
jgi:hypothetical protein